MAKAEFITAPEFEAQCRQHDLWIYFGVDKLKVRAAPSGNSFEYVELMCGHAIRLRRSAPEILWHWNDPLVCQPCDEMQTFKLVPWTIREGSRAWLDRQKKTKKAGQKNEKKTNKKP